MSVLDFHYYVKPYLITRTSKELYSTIYVNSLNSNNSTHKEFFAKYIQNRIDKNQRPIILSKWMALICNVHHLAHQNT